MSFTMDLGFLINLFEEILGAPSCDGLSGQYQLPAGRGDLKRHALYPDPDVRGVPGHPDGG